jgi:CrcB protein
VTALLVATGGAAGVLARYGLGIWVPSIWTIAAINLAGSFLLGALLHASWPEALRDGIGIGFLGGFTTFSTLSVQAILEAEGGRTGTAAAYVAVSVVGGLLAALAGYKLLG